GEASREARQGRGTGQDPDPAAWQAALSTERSLVRTRTTPPYSWVLVRARRRHARGLSTPASGPDCGRIPRFLTRTSEPSHGQGSGESPRVGSPLPYLLITTAPQGDRWPQCCYSRFWCSWASAAPSSS